jgi:hypothetical protein
MSGNTVKHDEEEGKKKGVLPLRELDDLRGADKSKVSGVEKEHIVLALEIV